MTNCPYVVLRSALIGALLLCAATGLAQTPLFNVDQVFTGNADLRASGTLTTTLDDARQKVVKFVARENVYLHLPKEELTLYCDSLIYSDAEQKAVALGNPTRVVQKDIKATCNRLEIFPALGKSVLTGNPVIDQKDGTRLAGERIVIVQNEDGTIDLTVEAPRVAGKNRGATIEVDPPPQEDDVEEVPVPAIPGDDKQTTAGAEAELAPLDEPDAANMPLDEPLDETTN